MPKLTGSPQSIPLGAGYAIRAPGVRGEAELIVPRPLAARAAGRVLEEGTEALDDALAASGMTEVRQVVLTLQPSSPAEATRSLRSPDRQEVFELEMPDLGPDTGQVVLACDEGGVLTWHLPVDADLAVETPASRGSGGMKRFRIRATRVHQGSPDDASARGLLGWIGKKLLKVLIYPVTDPVIGAISELFAGRWEAKRRPYGLRSLTSSNRREASTQTLARSDWTRLAGGRALLFVHGTFSTAHAGFGDMPDDVFDELYRRYDGRVFAFNHYSMSADPMENVDWLLTNLPGSEALTVDIVCHSRGGLVARALAEQRTDSPIKVRRIVHVAVPNNGTLLAHPDHMVKMIDRFTTILNLFPSGPVTETLEALITAIKVIGHGALKGLPGLAAMKPSGEFLNALNVGGASGTGYYAIAADYEPTSDAMKALVAGDAVLDRVFNEVPNDLVVPEPGVAGANGGGAFPLPAAQVLQIPASAGIIHTCFFGYPPVGAQLLEWLPG